MPGAVVIGAGPGIGAAVARRFAREGMPIALIGRNPGKLAEIEEATAPVLRLAADAADETALRGALDAAAAEFGVPDAVVYNAALVRPDRIGELSACEHLDAWAVNVGGALTAAARVAPDMARRGSGTFIVTGGMPEPKPGYASLSLGKAGVRTLVALLDQEYGPSGVHAATVTVDGPVAAGTFFDPDRIAEHYWRLHVQPRGEWQREIVHTPG